MAREGLVRVTTMRQAEGRRPHMTHVWKRIAQVQGSGRRWIQHFVPRTPAMESVVRAGLTDMLQGKHNPDTLEPLRAVLSHIPVGFSIEQPQIEFPLPEEAKRLYHFERARHYALPPDTNEKALTAIDIVFRDSVLDTVKSHLENLLAGESFAPKIYDLYALMLLGQVPDDYEEVIRKGTDPIVATPHPRIYSQYAPFQLQWLNKDAYMYLLGYELSQYIEDVISAYSNREESVESVLNQLSEIIEQIDTYTGAGVIDEWNKALAGGYYPVDWDFVEWDDGKASHLANPLATNMAFGEPIQYWMTPADFLTIQERI